MAGLLREAKVVIKERLTGPRPGNVTQHLKDSIILAFRIRPYYFIEGWLAGTEAATLYRLAASLPLGSRVVEIGSWKGKSTYCLARGLKAGGHVIAIDPFDAYGEEGSAAVYEREQGVTPLYEQFRHRMSALHVLKKIRVLRGYSQQFVGKVGEIDLLFVDGDHSMQGCSRDYDNFAPEIRKGGYLAIHDYYADEQQSGPTWLVEKRVLPSGEYRFVGLFHSLWVAQKR